MYFSTKNYLKNIHNHTAKHALNVLETKMPCLLHEPRFFMSDPISCVKYF